MQRWFIYLSLLRSPQWKVSTYTNSNYLCYRRHPLSLATDQLHYIDHRHAQSYYRDCPRLSPQFTDISNAPRDQLQQGTKKSYHLWHHHPYSISPWVEEDAISDNYIRTSFSSSTASCSLAPPPDATLRPEDGKQFKQHCDVSIILEYN